MNDSATTNEIESGRPRVCVVVSRYNETVTSRLLEGAERAFRARHGDEAPLGVVEAPGAFELVALATAAVESGAYDGVVTLGCVIRGETDHDRYISQAVASGLASLTIQSGVPVAFGVITANTADQAIARAGGVDGTGDGNKGVEAMDALLHTLDGMDHLYGAAADGVVADYRLAGESADKAAQRVTAARGKGN